MTRNPYDSPKSDQDDRPFSLLQLLVSLPAPIRYTLGGVIGGALGVGLWVWIALSMGLEAGWVALAVGLLVGIGFRLGAWLDGDEGSFDQGAWAAILAAAAIVAAKYVLFRVLRVEGDFANMFNGYESIWFLLAAATAFKFGVGF